jgi:chromosome segregation ATPase
MWQRYEKSQKVLSEESNNTCTIVTQSKVGPGDPQVDELFANRSEANAESSFFNSMLKEKVDSMTEELQNQNTRLTKEVQEMREKIKSFKSVEEECLRVKLENAQMQADAAEQEKKDQKKIKELEESKADLEKRLNEAEKELQATRENVHQVSTQSRIAKAREESAVSNSETELAVSRQLSSF